MLLEINHLEKRLEKKLNDVNSFIKRINKTKEMLTYFKDKNQKPKNIYKKSKTLTSMLEPIDTVFIIGSNATSVTLSKTGLGLRILPTTDRIVCSKSIANKVLHKLIINKDNKINKQYEKDQQTNKSFDKL